LAVDVLKLSHHGSQKNTSRELLEYLTYHRVLVSTNGERFSHPHPQSIAGVVAGREGVALHFNYTSECTA
jgi:beta-lactamase superfamily II metal-dependent hydrolase